MQREQLQITQVLNLNASYSVLPLFNPKSSSISILSSALFPVRISSPCTEFSFNSAMELALALEKLTNEKLLSLHQVVETMHTEPKSEGFLSEVECDHLQFKKLINLIASLCRKVVLLTVICCIFFSVT